MISCFVLGWGFGKKFAKKPKQFQSETNPDWHTTTNIRKVEEKGRKIQMNTRINIQFVLFVSTSEILKNQGNLIGSY